MTSDLNKRGIEDEIEGGAKEVEGKVQKAVGKVERDVADQD
jgi:uncharacterized protein YjbJ (UPF0337 family)